MRRRRSCGLSFVLAALLAVAGCTGDTVFSHYRSVDEGGWLRADTLVFPVQPIAATGSYDCLVGLRTTSRYPYADLTVVVVCQNVTSGQQRTDTVCVSLADDKGRILGTGVALVDHHALLATYSLAAGDSLRLILRHDMKLDPLPGIADAGLTLIRR